MQQEKKRMYFPEINILRIFSAAFIAFVYHYGILYGAQPYCDRLGMSYLYQFAGYGVELFFAVSGFVLYYSYYNRIRNAEQSFGTFMLGRIIRIYPVMVLTVIVAAIGQWISLFCYGHVATLDIGDGRNTLAAFILNLLGVQCGWFANHDSMSINGPTWFISIIMICYMIFFLILKYCGKNKTKENVCFIGIMLLGVYLYVKPMEFPLLYGSCGRGYLNFFFGVMLAKAVEKIDTTRKRGCIVVLAVIAIALYYVMYRKQNLGNMDLAVSILFDGALILLFTNVSLIRKIADNKLVDYLGKISFSVYLWNIPIAIWVYLVQEMSGWNIPFAGREFFWMHMVVSVVIAIMTYELYEKKITRWLKKKVEQK